MNKQQFVKTLFLLFSGLIGNSSIWGQAIYGLQKVTSVEDKGLYVFENNNHVLNGIIASNGSLQSLGSYSLKNLRENESYVWKLEANSGGYYIRNMANPSSMSLYLNNRSSNLLSFSSKETIWTFSFVGDSAIIRKKNGNGLGDTGIYADPYYCYKLYSDGNLARTYHGFTVYQLVSSIPASVSSIEYSTFSSEYALDFSGEPGLTVYTAAVNEAKTKVMLREVTSKRVPANTAVVLHGSTGSYTASIIESADEITDNQLQTATSEMRGADHNIYVLNKKNGVVGFYKLSATGKLAKGKAYITIEGNGSAPMLSMSEDLNATTIEMLSADACQYQKSYYTLDGRRVERPTKGVYVVNGKKIIIR